MHGNREGRWVGGNIFIVVNAGIPHFSYAITSLYLVANHIWGLFVFLVFFRLVSYRRGPAYHDGHYAMVFLVFLVIVGTKRGKGKLAELSLFHIVLVSYLLIYVCPVFVLSSLCFSDYYVLCTCPAIMILGCVTYVRERREKNCFIDHVELRMTW